jgi:ATPase subunit of ABC transporter with duplicated ATPase domains
MLVTIDIEAKSIGNKHLFNDLHFSVENDEKVAIIGRNGVGKTTLFRMLSDQDKDFAGSVQFRKGTRVMTTAQEHAAVGEQTVLDYVIGNLPDYARLKEIVDTYPDTMGSDMRKIEIYSNALEKFSEAGYYNVEDNVLQSLDHYQIDEAKARRPMRLLSGGQKRFVELVRIEHANCDVALIDEPTNHMDYVAKAEFINWLKNVLQSVDKIIEIKDGKAHIVKGNYVAYLKQNATATTAKMHDYEIGQRTLLNLEKQIGWARARKPSWHGTADQRNPFVVMERRLTKQADELRENLVKPSIWIDQESAAELKKGASDNYEKYKSKNIRINSKTAVKEDSRELLRIEDLQLGYGEKSLFKPANATLHYAGRLQLIGRNGAGKTTLVRAITDAAKGKKSDTWRAGSIFCDKKLRLSVYEQETDAALLDLTLYEAIEQIYSGLDLPVSNEIVMRMMGDYLFDPYQDARLPVEQLSGGQKARLQIIKLMAPNPNMLILDEPTNHLDLPSIEELENALRDYHGAILYVSHDSFFAKNIGGEKLTLLASE